MLEAAHITRWKVLVNIYRIKSYAKLSLILLQHNANPESIGTAYKRYNQHSDSDKGRAFVALRTENIRQNLKPLCLLVVAELLARSRLL